MTTLEKEIEFGEMFGKYRLSPPDVDMKDHWDVSVPWGYFWAKMPLGPPKHSYSIQEQPPYTFDVKAQPKGQQSHSYRWVELQNVNGDTGWLYGKADFIAFEYTEYWIIVNREKLIALVEPKIDLSTPAVSGDWVANPQPYRLHRRLGRKDAVIMVPVVDLCWIGAIISKPKSNG